jgi:hypothetical protein
MKKPLDHVTNIIENALSVAEHDNMIRGYIPIADESLDDNMKGLHVESNDGDKFDVMIIETTP